MLAPHRELFRRNGIELVISSPSVVETCSDKWNSYRFLLKLGLRTPKTYLGLDAVSGAIKRDEISCPLVIKPRWGSGSIGIAVVDDLEDLSSTYRLLDRVVARSILAEAGARHPGATLVVQEYIQGEEHGLDIVNDLQGQYVTTFVRRKLAMRAGETDRAVTVASDEMVRIGATIGQRLGHVGNLDCDAFVTESGIYILKMNPRFGGGYPFSHAAGADLPAAFLAWAAGEEPDSRWLQVRSSVRAAKCERIVLLDS